MSKDIKLRDNSIHNRIARIRFELGLKAKEFANILGVAPASISRYENTERLPDYTFLEKLVTELNVNPMYLFDKSENMFF